MTPGSRGARSLTTGRVAKADATITAHTFRVQSPVARLLGILSPGAVEQLFRNLSVPADERRLPARGQVPFDVAAVMREQTRLATVVVGPPMAAVD
jgi:hypothetical protein